MGLNINSVSEAYASQTSYTKNKITEEKKTDTVESTTNQTGFSEDAVVYEKTDRSAIVAQLKADNEARINSMQKMVQEMISGQGQAIGQADDIWSFLASGKFTVTEAAKKQAQEAISEDGYWGVKQTSDRILEFAKALSGNDVSKADTLLNAFRKGFAQATKAWGKELPDISQQTYKAVEEKFAAWKKEAEQTTTTAATDSQTI